MSAALAGSLHEASFEDVLATMVREARTGVLRLRYAGPDGAQRGEVVLAKGLLVGGAIYRAGGFKGTGDALVEAALCSPEDALGALEYAAQTAQYVPGTLAEGAARAGVSQARVEETLLEHLRWVVRTMRGWRAGSWELLLEGLPADAADRDSAASRAFLLDRGVDSSALEAARPPETPGPAAATVPETDVTRKSKAAPVAGRTPRPVPAPGAPAQPTPSAPSGPLFQPPPSSPEQRPGVVEMDTEPEFRVPDPAAAGAGAEPIAGAAADAGDAPAPAGGAEPAPVAADAARASEELAPAPEEPAPLAAEAAPASEVPAPAAETASPDASLGAAPDDPAAAAGEAPAALESPFGPAPESLSDEPTPADDLGGPSPVFESPAGDLAAEEPEPPAPVSAPAVDAPRSSLGEEELFADAEPAPADEPEPEEAAAAAEPAPDEPDDEITQVDPPGEIDWSAPGGAEAALMEAETLLDSEVLSVMLEMGNSAAATASETKPGAERILTGHLVLVDDEGQLTGVVLAVPLREAGYVVHIVRGLEPASEALARAAADGQQPLAVVDLLLKRGDDGMLGGLDLAERAGELGIPSILLGEAGDDVKARAEAAGVAALLPRPLRSDLKNEGIRGTFVDAVLAAVDSNRPTPTWVAPTGENLETLPPPEEEEGWDVQEIERKAEEVEDLPDFAMIDPAARMESLWRETFSALAGPLSRPEVLLQVLRFGAEVLTRAVLFTPSSGKKGKKKKKELVGFGQFGIELAPGVDADEAVRRIRLPIEGHPLIAQAIEGRQPIKAAPGGSEWEAHLTMALGGVAPAEVFLGPVFCQGELAALLYGDMLPEQAPLPDTTNLEVLIGQAGLALSRTELEARLAVLERKE